jgi:hypothetical protein
MAITINSAPKQYSPVYNCLIYCLFIDDIGSANIVRRIAYQLVNEDDEPITAVESVRPFAAFEPICFDFTLDIRGLVSTAYPSVDTGAAQEDAVIFYAVKLKYWEIVTDTITCETTELSPSYTSICNIWNGGTQIYESENYEMPMLGNHYPDRMAFGAGARPHMWILRGVYPDPIQATYTINGGFVPTVLNVPSGHKASILPMYPEGLGMVSINGVRSMEISIPALNRSFVITYDVGSSSAFGDDPCGEDLGGGAAPRALHHVMFLDSLGGRSMISFEYVDELAMSTEQGIICAYRRCDTGTSEDNGNTYNKDGVSISNKVANERLTLIADADNSKDMMELYKAFLASTEYHIQSIYNEQIQFRRFILDTGSIVYFKVDDRIELRVSGYFAAKYRTIYSH